MTNWTISAGRADPLGATFDGEGVNFAVFSVHARKVTLCLFTPDGRTETHRIELPEVEAALQQTPGVRAAVALVRLSAAGQQELVAYVSPAAGATLAAGAVRDALAARVPAAMVPARVYVLLPDLPRLTSGKVNRAALDARA